jgi:hypothetical protein
MSPEPETSETRALLTKALGIIDALIKEVERLNERVKKLEHDVADVKQRLEQFEGIDPFEDVPGG